MKFTTRKEITLANRKCRKLNPIRQPAKVSKRSTHELEMQSEIGDNPSGRNAPEEQVATETNLATTQFVDDAIVKVEEENYYSTLLSKYLNMNDSQTTEESIHSFLQRPIKLASGNFATTDTITTFTDVTFPNLVFANANAKIWREKLSGYYGIRCDFRIKIVFNSNRFQQGRYMMVWMPMCGAFSEPTNIRTLIRINEMQHTLVQRTTLKHVEFDINSGTSAELVIPYASVDTFFPIEKVIAGTYDRILGVLSLCPYSPLVAPSGSTVVPYTIYVSLENVKLFGVVEPQSGLGQDISKKEASKYSGPVSGVARRFAKAFDELSGVPLIVGYALGASWISDRVAQTASIFGYSKPSQGDALSKVVILNNNGHSNVDGDSAVRSLSYLSNPATMPLSGSSGTAVDEMDFSYITQIPAWFNTFNWASATVADSIITTYSVTPNQYFLATGYYNYPPVAFVAQHFNAWRGSIIFKFKFVKTEFHSGRLSFEFSPTTNPAFVGPSNPAYVDRQIVDIREIDEVTIQVPYISTTPFVHLTEIIGRLSVRIVDPLVAPSAVASTVTILAEVCAGQDFEVAMPSNNTLIPVRVLSRQSGITSSRSVSFTIGNSKVVGDPVMFSSTSIGDKVSSVRTYVKRYYTMNNSGDTYALNLPILVAQPDVIFVAEPTRLPATVYRVSDVLGTWALCYGMWSGGVRLKDVMSMELTNYSSGTSKVTTYSRNHLDVPTVTTLLSSINYTNVFCADTVHSVLQQYTNNNCTIEVEIPQYTLPMARAVGDCICYSDGVLALERPRSESMTQQYVHFSPPRDTVITGASFNKHFHNLYRSGADDTNFSVFLSIPPMDISINNGPNHQYSL